MGQHGSKGQRILRSLAAARGKGGSGMAGIVGAISSVSLKAGHNSGRPGGAAGRLNGKRGIKAIRPGATAPKKTSATTFVYRVLLVGSMAEMGPEPIKNSQE